MNGINYTRVVTNPIIYGLRNQSIKNMLVLRFSYLFPCVGESNASGGCGCFGGSGCCGGCGGCDCVDGCDGCDCGAGCGAGCGDEMKGLNAPKVGIDSSKEEKERKATTCL